jgi:phytoene desaturase
MTGKPPHDNLSTKGTALVIGAGFGGIAAALRLRALGYKVQVVDRAPMLGGRAQVFERDGYRHDAGPTVITAPFLFEELFTLYGKKLEDYVELRELEPWYRFYFADGDTFDYGGTVEQTLAEIGRFSERDKQGYLKLLEHSRKIFDAGFSRLADQPFHSVWRLLAAGPKLFMLQTYNSVWQMVSKYISHPKVRQAFSIQPLLVGGNPFDTTSIYGLIHFLERKWGVFFAMGGTGALVASLGQLMSDAGIEVRLNTTVKQIQVEAGVATGAILESGEVIAADMVVSNVDPMYLYRHMLPADIQSTAVKLKQRKAHLSMGLFVLYFGTTRQYPEVAHHTIWMGERYQSLLDEIFNQYKLTEDFSLYLHRPTATDCSFAPEGCDSWYVLAPVPNLKADVDWKVEGPRLRDRIVKALGETIVPGLEDVITADFFMTPEDFRDDYLSVEGAGFSVAPLFTQSAWFRFHNRAEGVENLYLVGAGTHPGAGMPGVLCSAKVLENLVSDKPIDDSLSRFIDVDLMQPGPTR